MIRRRHVEVAGDQQVRVFEQPLPHPLGEGFEEADLELVVPVVDCATVWDVHRRHPQRLRCGDQAADDPGPPCAARVAPPLSPTGKDSPSRSRLTRSTPRDQPATGGQPAELNALPASSVRLVWRAAPLVVPHQALTQPSVKTVSGDPHRRHGTGEVGVGIP
jgi:hypothetical protein